MNMPEAPTSFPIPEAPPNRHDVWRQELRGKIHPENLPVAQRRGDIQKLIQTEITPGNGGVVLIQGETGSGKSILLPGILREALQSQHLPLKTLVVQPRRDAALNVSRAIAAVEDLSWGESGIVGCSTSEAKEVGKFSEIPVVTTGVALRYLSRWLEHSENTDFKPEFGAIMVDEFHENSIEYHLILGMLQVLRERGKSPFVVLTSATLDKEKIQSYFGMTDEQYLKAEGRLYPVEKRYLLQRDDDSVTGREQDYIREAASEVKSLLQERNSGDILVFMPGAKQIQSTIKTIGDIPGVEVVPLHGSLSVEERNAVIWSRPPTGVRRVIVSTNVAETSLTLPDITAVVDSCRFNSVHFNEATGIYEKTIELISRDSAEQRAGRAGRVQSGICSRLVNEDEWESMPEHTIPEIMRANLSHVVLKLRGMGIAPQEFPFMDPPELKRLEEAERFLVQLGALDAQGKLTEAIGKRMLDMPFFEPSLARMVVESERTGELNATLVLATLERESTLFYQPSQREISACQTKILAENGYTVPPGSPARIFGSSGEINSARAQDMLRNALQQARYTLRAEYAQVQSQFGIGSDWLRNLRLFSAAIEQGVLESSRSNRTPIGHATQMNFSRWCRDNHVNEQALKHTAAHLSDYTRALGIEIDFASLQKSLDTVDWDVLDRVILSGHPHKLLYRSPDHARGMPEYHFFGSPDGDEINLSPGSAAFESKPQCCIASGRISEGSGTKNGMKITRRYAPGVHPVSAAQIEQVFPDMLEESINESGIQLDPEREGAPVATVNISPKGCPYIVLGEKRVFVSREQSIDFFAQQLATQYQRTDLGYRIAEFSFHHRNLSSAREIDFLRQRFGGEVKPLHLVLWYKEQLSALHTQNEVVDLSVLEKYESQLLIQKEDFLSQEHQHEIEQFYPERFSLPGFSGVNVSYFYSADQQPPIHRARLSFDISSLSQKAFWSSENALQNLTLEQLPPIGRPSGDSGNQSQIQLEFSATLPDFRIVGPFHSLEELKTQADARMDETAWLEFLQNHSLQKNTLGTIDPFKEIPRYDEQPLVYRVDREGNNLLAYPFLTRNSGWNGNGYVRTYEIQWVRNKQTAADGNQETREYVQRLLRETPRTDQQEQVDRVERWSPPVDDDDFELPPLTKQDQEEDGVAFEGPLAAALRGAGVDGIAQEEVHTSSIAKEKMMSNSPSRLRREIHSEAQEKTIVSSLPDEVLSAILSIKDSENRTLAIMEQHEIWDARYDALLEEQEALSGVVSTADELNKQCVDLRKRKEKIGRDLKSLTERTSDKEKRGKMLLERNSVDQELDDAEQKLKAIRQQKSRLINLEKEIALCQEQRAELARMEEEALG
ncbi:MAG: DEAD/DEAH box helicase [Candidatus Moranbacteria bacterium]|nr:DEAD/DEAH box helicase [Candidatus Moranbacteria bacterium]MBP9801822.1 DEAD/DEAH box helicase [Candidatus Moranbacteria bacterium]